MEQKSYATVYSSKWLNSCNSTIVGGLSNHMENLENTLHVLKSIAGKFKKDSEQDKAIEEAVWALTFLKAHFDLKAAYEKFRIACSQELSEEHKQHLRDMGIDPDEKLNPLKHEA
jgi:hypothetical protein